MLKLREVNHESQTFEIYVDDFGKFYAYKPGVVTITPGLDPIIGEKPITFGPTLNNVLEDVRKYALRKRRRISVPVHWVRNGRVEKVTLTGKHARNYNEYLCTYEGGMKDTISSYARVFYPLLSAEQCAEIDRLIEVAAVAKKALEDYQKGLPTKSVDKIIDPILAEKGAV